MQVTEFTSMIVNLPYSKTKVEDFDSQQVMGNDMNIIIVVSGTIRFDGKKPHVFSDNIVLQQEESKYYIASQNFRIMSE